MVPAVAQPTVYLLQITAQVVTLPITNTQPVLQVQAAQAALAAQAAQAARAVRMRFREHTRPQPRRDDCAGRILRVV